MKKLKLSLFKEHKFSHEFLIKGGQSSSYYSITMVFEGLDHITYTAPGVTRVNYDTGQQAGNYSGD